MDEGNSEDDPALVDLLRAMISGTHYSYAEMWAPILGDKAHRHLLAASYARPGKGFDSMLSMESLSRVLALRPGDCVLRHAPKDGAISTACVQEVNLGPGSHVSTSPRASAMRVAEIATAMSFCIVAGQLDWPKQKLAIVVFMSQRGPAEDAKQRAADALHLERLANLCTTANPYLVHLNRTRHAGAEGAQEQLSSRHLHVASVQKFLGEGETNDGSRLDDKQFRSPIAYKSPMRRKFNHVSEDIRPKHSQPSQSPSGRNFSPSSGTSFSVDYEIAMAEALSKFPRHESGKPHALRTSALWNIFEQYCSANRNTLLVHMRNEFKDAIFSQDLMANDDGSAMIRMPYFDLIQHATQQVAECDDKVAQLVLQLEQLHRHERHLAQTLQDNQQVMTKLERKCVLTERKLVKLKLLFFFKSKSMPDELRRKHHAQIEALNGKISGLERRLVVEQDMTRHYFTEQPAPGPAPAPQGSDLVDVMAASLRLSACVPAEMQACHSMPPVQLHSRGEGMSVEMDELGEQLLMLRNANLTLYERESQVLTPEERHKHMQRALQDKYGYLCTMEGVEGEILQLDQALPLAHQGKQFHVDKYRKMLDDAHQVMREEAKAQASKYALGYSTKSGSLAASTPASAAPHAHYHQEMKRRDERHWWQRSRARERFKYVMARRRSDGEAARAALSALAEGARSAFASESLMPARQDMRSFSRAGSVSEEEEERTRNTEEEEDGKAAAFWLEQNKSDDIDVFKMWRKRAVAAAPRQRVRTLDAQQAIECATSVLLRKTTLDALAQADPLASRHSVEEVLYLYLEERYGSCHVADLVAFDLLTAITRHSTTNKMLQMFSKCLSGGLFDGHWMYMLRVMTLTKALYPRGFRNISDVQNFLIHQFYADQPPNEIDKVMAWLALFPSYNRRVAEGGGTGAGGAQSPLSPMNQSTHMQTASDSRHMPAARSEPTVHATPVSSQVHATHVSSQALSDSAAQATLDPTDLSCDLFAEFIAYLVEQDQEIRVKKVAIMAQVHGLDRSKPMSYDEFERFAYACIPYDLEVAGCQECYRLLVKVHADTVFPPARLALCVAILEIDHIMAKYRVALMHP